MPRVLDVKTSPTVQWSLNPKIAVNCSIYTVHRSKHPLGHCWGWKSIFGFIINFVSETLCNWLSEICFVDVCLRLLILFLCRYILLKVWSISYAAKLWNFLVLLFVNCIAPLDFTVGYPGDLVVVSRNFSRWSWRNLLWYLYYIYFQSSCSLNICDWF